MRVGESLTGCTPRSLELGKGRDSGRQDLLSGKPRAYPEYFFPLAQVREVEDWGSFEL